jgi:hypothetical protein
MPGNEHETARALDTYLAAAKTRVETFAID